MSGSDLVLSEDRFHRSGFLAFLMSYGGFYMCLLPFFPFYARFHQGLLIVGLMPGSKGFIVWEVGSFGLLIMAAVVKKNNQNDSSESY